MFTIAIILIVPSMESHGWLSITLSFMVVGHTKFTPDSCFGLVKQQYRRKHVECLSDIVDVVNKSGYINHTRLG